MNLSGRLSLFGCRLAVTAGGQFLDGELPINQWLENQRSEFNPVVTCGMSADYSGRLKAGHCRPDFITLS